MRRRGPSKYRYVRGPANERNRSEVAAQRAHENKERAQHRLAVQAAPAREPKLMPFEIERLREMGIRALQSVATKAGITGAYRMRKAEIIERLSTVS